MQLQRKLSCKSNHLQCTAGKQNHLPILQCLNSYSSVLTTVACHAYAPNISSSTVMDLQVLVVCGTEVQEWLTLS